MANNLRWWNYVILLPKIGPQSRYYVGPPPKLQSKELVIDLSNLGINCAFVSLVAFVTHSINLLLVFLLFYNNNIVVYVNYWIFNWNKVSTGMLRRV
jgi:hypothetical protein